MGSSALPMVGMGSYGNPTGVDTGAGLNPNFEAETFKKLQGFATPSTAKAMSPVPFGGTGITPFSGANNPTLVPTIPTVPTAAPVPTQAAPGTGSGQGGSTSIQSTPVTQNNTGGNFGNVVPGGTTSPSTLSPADMNNASFRDLQFGLAKTYGSAGLGRNIANILANGAGWNPDVAKAMMNDLEPYFQENMGNIMEQFGSAGQRYSSTAALAAGKFTADFTSHQEALYAQMYQWAVGNYMSLLTGGKVGGPQQSSGLMGMISGGLGLLSSGAGAATAGMAASEAGAGGGAALLAGLAAL